MLKLQRWARLSVLLLLHRKRPQPLKAAVFPPRACPLHPAAKAAFTL